VFRAIKGVTHDDLAQFGEGVNVTEHAVEHIEQPLQVVLGVACRTWTQGLEQAFPLCGSNASPVLLERAVPLSLCLYVHGTSSYTSDSDSVLDGRNETFLYRGA
jgi:hypothetical protein